jgi:hypothetical protein
MEVNLAFAVFQREAWNLNENEVLSFSIHFENRIFFYGTKLKLESLDAAYLMSVQAKITSSPISIL